MNVSRWFMQSLRRRLLLWLLPATFLVGALASLGTYWGAVGQLSDLLNEQMRYVAEHVNVDKDGAVTLAYRPHRHDDRDREGAILLQVWHDGQLEYTTDPDVTFPPPAATGFSAVQIKDQLWHTAITRREGRWVLVAMSQDVRWEALAGVAVHLFWPVLSLLPLLALFLWFGIGYGLRPLRLITAELTRRNVNSMEPIDVAAFPSEVQPFACALNDLLQRLEQAITMQKDFIADAAHELRTPIMGLAIQAQLALRATDQAERQIAGAQLQISIERLSRIAEQLLALARLEPNAKTRIEPVELAALCKAVITDHLRQAELKDIDLGLAEQVPAVVYGDYDSLRILLNNLVDNAIRYIPAGGHVDLAVARSEQGIALSVCDDGPGIPVHERSRVMERFYRGSASQTTGSGLGLSIVRRIAERQGASVSLSAGPDGKGLRVRVLFPGR